MKHIQAYLPTTLVLGYSIYSAFITVNLAHSLILFSLTGLYCFHQFLLRQENTSNKSFAQFKQEMERDLTSYKEACNARFSKQEDEIAKLSLNTMPRSASSSSSQTPSARKMVF